MSSHVDFPTRHDAPTSEWRALEHCVFRFVRAHGGSLLLAETAAWCSLADGLGHTRLSLDGGHERTPLRRLDDAEIDALRDEALVGDGTRVTPFVLRDRCFWLWRNFAAERAVAQALVQRMARRARPFVVAPELIEALFAQTDASDTAQQRRAVQQVGQHGLSLLTGAPGTGKTTTVLRMLLALIATADPQPLRIAVAAPTGKAAQRLLQALRDGVDALRAGNDARLRPLLAALPEFSASTVHRLLGQRASGATAARLIDADVVVVDEASMLDLQLLRQLLQALPADALLILVGDPDQLASVEAGSVLTDIDAAIETLAGPQRLRLSHVFRSDRELQSVHAAVRAGDVLAFAAAMQATSGRVVLHAVTERAQLAQRIAVWAQLLAADLAEIGAGHGSAELAATALQLLGRRQLLCALRDGEYGAQQIARALERQLRDALGVPADAGWFHGRSVIVGENDYAHGLFNGDIGVALRDADGTLRVWFAAVDRDGTTTMRALAPELLPQHDGAGAITIHKSQGSEYAHVGIVLPPLADSRVLSRQLLYTALSRAKSGIEIWGSDAALAAAMARPVLRDSGLVDAIILATTCWSDDSRD